MGIIAKLKHLLFGDTCKGCKHNNKDQAKEMFIENYCTLWGCKMTGRFQCNYKEKVNRN